MKHTIKIDKNTLPSNKEDAYDLLFDYFSNHELEISESSTGFEIEISRKNFLYCDESLGALNWLGIDKSKVIDFYIEGAQSFLSLLESWVPYGWSKYISKNKYAPKHLTIIHLDDHQDLMPPAIGISHNEWTDMLTGKTVRLSDPDSMRSAIKSGAITLGSMMTPLIHHIENIDVLHLAQNSETIVRHIEKTTCKDQLATPEIERMSLTLSKNSTSKNFYIKTSQISDLMQHIRPSTDIFLHIDMDFFNNRFNGSTDWMDRPLRHNPTLAEQKGLMSSFCQQLKASGATNGIKHFSLGISPSFYPSEYWKDGTTHLLQELDSIGVEVKPLMKGLNLNAAPQKKNTTLKKTKTLENTVVLKQGKGQIGKGGMQGGFFWHIYHNDIRAGKVFINYKPDINKAYIQIFLNKKKQGKGIGRIAYRKACEYSGYDAVYAEMRKNNKASIKAATAAGFKTIPSNTNQTLMVWKKR